MSESDVQTQNTQKIVINNRHGGFGISEKAVRWLREHGYDIGDEFTLPGEEYDDGSVNDIGWMSSYGSFLDDELRADDGLVAVVEELGVDANGGHASLKIVEIPEDVDWEIKEYDGNEWVAETHRTWS